MVFLLFVGAAFIVLSNLAFLDWKACLFEVPLSPTTWHILLPRPLQVFWIYYLPVVPLGLLAFGKDKPDRFAWIATGFLLALGLWLMLPSDAMHDCDRKGSTADFALLILLPVSVLFVFVILASQRSIKTQG